MVEQVWKNKALPVDGVYKPLANAYAKHLMGGVMAGYGKSQINFSTPDGEMLAALQNNVWQFSAAKNYAQLKAIGQKLIDDTGKLRSYKDFKLEAYKINNEHVNQWLKAEYELAVSGSQMASKWVTITEQQGNLPLLEFDAVIDMHTSSLCRSLNRTLLPINHPFWDTYYPPNHFNCRSTVWQRGKGKVTPESKIAAPEIPAMFRANLAKERLVFPAKHPYFDGLPKEVLSFGDANFVKDNLRTGKGNVYESGLAYKENKNPKAHTEARRKLAEYHVRKDVANAMANHFNEDVFINPEFNTVKDYRYNYFFKNAPIPLKQPDLIVGKQFWEVESYEGKFKPAKVATMLKSGAAQSNRIIIKLNHNVDVANIIRQAKGTLQKSTKHLTNVKEVLIVDVFNKVHVIK